MAKFYGVVGYGTTVEIRDGVWDDVIEEHPYYGDVIRDTRKLDNSERIVPNIVTGNSISIVADPYAFDHFFAIRYVKWANVLWIVTEVEVKQPRLILRLGGVYNGPTPRTTPHP